MKKQRLPTAVSAALGMLVLILDGKTTLSGASEGVNLCIKTLIPSLFPFFLLSTMLTGALSGQTIRLLRPIASACKIPKGAESLLAIGVLGGYPVGAQNVAQLHGSGQLSGEQAARMITFCNNAGPAFLFGVLGSMFSDSKYPWLLWLIHISSALLVGMLLPGSRTEGAVRPLSRSVTVTDALAQAVKVMGLVCGWVVLMRMMLAFLEHWFLWLLPPVARVVIAGALELSNGCVRLPCIENEGLRFILASAMLAAGGVCVSLQTASVAQEIPLRLYFPGKLLQCGISVLLSCAVQFLFPAQMRQNCSVIMPIAAVCSFLSFLILKKIEKVLAFHTVVVYNDHIHAKEVRSCCFAKK